MKPYAIDNEMIHGRRARVRYGLAGEPLTICLHGWGGSPEWSEANIPIQDLPGSGTVAHLAGTPDFEWLARIGIPYGSSFACGNSLTAPASMTLGPDDDVAHIEAVRAELARRVSPSRTLIVAFSNGGHAALRWAALRGETEGVDVVTFGSILTEIPNRPWVSAPGFRLRGYHGLSDTTIPTTRVPWIQFRRCPTVADTHRYFGPAHEVIAYAGGHEVTPVTLAAAWQWFSERASAARSTR